jgi:peptide/nickel transport system permease protein
VLTYAARRLLLAIPVLALASVVVFFGVSSVGDPLHSLRLQRGASEQTIQNIIERKHLDEPLPAQYLHWLQEAASERFGTTASGRPIWPDLRRALGNTLQLVLAAEALALLVGVAVGIASARRRHSWFDHSATVVSFLGYSIPIFWFALVLQVAFTNIYRATGVRIFYTSGLSSIDPGTGVAFLVDRLQHLALPVMAIAYVNVALYSRYMRASMLEAQDAEHVRAARARGLTESRVLRRHVVRNALVPVVTLAALGIGATFGGAIVTEAIFSLDGMGLFFLRALRTREVYAVMAFLMVTAVVVVLANLLADLVYALLDPRIRHE